MSLKSFHICLCSSWIWSWGPMFADTWAVFVEGRRWCLLKGGLGEGPPLIGLAFCLTALRENIGSAIISSPIENLLLCLHSLVSSSSLVSSHGVFMATGCDSHGQDYGLYSASQNSICRSGPLCKLFPVSDKKSAEIESIL